MASSDRKVRIPRSSTRRNDQCWARLLCRVDQSKHSPLAFQGKLLRCGAELPEAELWPAPEYPRVPVLLEHGGLANPGWGHKRSEQLYVLWKYQEGEWREIARAISAGADWVCDLLPAAARAIDDQSERVYEDCGQIAGKLLELIDLDLAGRRDMPAVLNLLYNGITHRMLEVEYTRACASGYTMRRGPETETRQGQPSRATGVDARCQAYA